MTTHDNTRDPGLFSEEEMSIISSFDVDEQGFVSLGSICWFFLNEQTQYVSRVFAKWDSSTPYLVKGLTFSGDNEHNYVIHNHDVYEFISRLREYRWSRGFPCA